MARVNNNLPVLPSLLDRLMDDEPEVLSDPHKSYGMVLSEIKDNIRRDLENLLNTRLYRQNIPKQYKALSQSVITYGLPDFGMIDFGADEGKNNFKTEIEQTIENFEPRFRRVNVELANIGEAFERVLHLKISAVLMIEPDPIPLMFDSKVKLLDKSLNLRVLNHG